MTTNLSFTIDAPTVATLSEGQDQPPTLAGLAVPLGVPSNPSQDGHRYQFDGAPDNPDELIDAVREHDEDALVGRLAAPWDSQEAGLHAAARIFNTSRGRDVLEEAREGARTGFSVGAQIKKFTTRNGVRHVAAGEWTAVHLGIVRRPAFTGAGFQVNASAAPEGKTMSTTAPEIHEFNTQDAPQLPTVAELAAQVAEVLKTDEDHHPLATFSNFAAFNEAFYDAVRAGQEDRAQALATAFAVPDQVTTDNPGVMPPGWRTQIKANVDKRQPMISAFGTIGLPPNGMSSSWPYLDPALDLDSIITQQAAEKDPLSGVLIKILKGDAPIHTAGAISDISYQLILRSSPSYLAAHNNILMAAWARYLERLFELKVVELGTDAGDMIDLSTAEAFRAELFAASADVEDATGAPAEFAFVDDATFRTLGGLPDLVNPKYGTNNVGGTASARSLTINVNGIDVKRAKFLEAGTVVVSNSEAAKAPTSGPRLATQENVRQLGRDVAVWGMYEEAEVYFPAGLRVYNTGV